MYSGVGDTTSLVPGFPIRTSSDQCSVDSSPRHNAASHVLHRLPVPRHPPCALKHLQHKKPIRKKKLHINTQTTPTPYGSRRKHLCARCSQPLSTNQTPHPTTKVRQQHADPTGTVKPPRKPGHGLVVSKPNSVFSDSLPASPPNSQVCCAPEPDPLQIKAHPTNRCDHRTPTRCGRVAVSWCSLERR
jgi:hypothetical protein